MKETTLLKMALGASSVSPLGLSGVHGWSARTRNPKTNIRVLNVSRENKYCFQFCGPLSSRCSHHRKTAQGRYFPSIIHAM